MQSAKKVIVAGHLCLDITPIFKDKKSTRVDEVLTPGKLLKMNGVDIHTGGAASNTVLAMKFLGADVQIMAKVGCDDLGAIATQILNSHGVNKGLIKDEGAATSYSVVLAIPGIHRIFLHDPGANDTYSVEDLRDADFEGVELFHFGYPPLMKKMYEEEGEELKKIFELVKRKGIPVSLDMAAVDPESEASKVDWGKLLKKVLPLVDIFVPSIEETLYMVDRKKYYDIMEMAAGRDATEVLDMETDIRPLAEYLLSLGSKIVLLKCGSAGIYLATAKEAELEELSAQCGFDLKQWSEKSLFETCFQPEKICSGTGAGDTCIAAFLMALLTGETAETSIKLAAAEGASCVEAYDALSGLRRLEELKEKIANGWQQY